MFDLQFYGISNDKTTVKTAFFDSPNNVNQINNGYSNVLFTTYISVTDEKGVRTVVGQIFWSYTYDKTAKKWVGNSSGTPILVDVSEFSSTAKKVLTINRINY